MKAVLYAHDLEPITIIDLHPDAWRRLAHGGTWNIAVFLPLKFSVSAEPVMQSPMPIVTINADRIIKGEYESLLLFTAQEEYALLLRAAFLPGQTKAMRDFNADAFYQGFFAALNQLR